MSDNPDSSQSVSLQRRFSQADFDRFAALSGDHNVIHIDAELAAHSRFGRPVAHGMLLYGVLRGLLEQLLPGARQASQQLTFLAPTFAGENMVFTASVLRREPAAVDVSVQVQRLDDGVVTCEGQCRMLPEPGL